MKKQVLLFTFLICISHFLYAQSDSVRPVRGIYNSYKEYLTNNPSFRKDFKITVFLKDSVVVMAEYQVPEDMYTGEVWGFCDGKDVFVASNTMFRNRYWKLQCRGPNPYFYYMSKTYFPPVTPGLLFMNIATSESAPVTDLMFVDHDGRTQPAKRFLLKDLLRDNKELFQKLKKEPEIYDELAKKYILQYNAEKLQTK